MKTYFVSSDIHGFYSIYRKALSEAGYQENNEDHVLIVLGDLFDRGKESKKVYSFLRFLPPSRRILIRGNHESLLLDLLRAGYPGSHDIHNGTYDTLKQFCFGYASLQKKIHETFLESLSLPYPERVKKNDALQKRLNHRLYHGKPITEVAKWIQSEEWVDYFETPRYVFVHAFIPTFLAKGKEGDWRNAPSAAWEDAKWACPFRFYLQGYWKSEEEKGKTLVCGHWHTSDFYNHMDFDRGSPTRLKKTDNPIYRSPAFPGIIGLDACTVLSGKVNVLVLREDELYPALKP